MRTALQRRTPKRTSKQRSRSCATDATRRFTERSSSSMIPSSRTWCAPVPSRRSPSPNSSPQVRRSSLWRRRDGNRSEADCRCPGQWLLDRIASGTEFEAALVVASQLVAGTCVGIAGAPGIDDEAFDLCIVDEASKATATETLVPLVRAKGWVLVGDEKQLPPFLDEALRDRTVQDDFGLDPDELKQTLFGRLARGLPAANSRSLNRQYRMVPQIGDLISACFYGGTLESADREPLGFTAELQGSPVCWLATDGLRGRGERETGGKTFLNLCEAREVMRHLKKLNKATAQTADERLHVLVLAPYLAQVSELARRVRQERERLSHLDVEVNTVDAAQGREADVLIFSTVRSNPQFKMGFVRDLERANVALSRGKYLLTIVGDASFFEQAGGPLGDVLRYV
ncbi:MAG: DEAD/DEAH box helicase family protein, partial [Fimbriimonadaceae bacterium]|nr:DEAD/DEAH box helicase family protein [Fimbriimonadaceae bacterium]